MSTGNTHPRTVLITGASTGIGEEYARRFAFRGYGLVLVARRAERLDALAAELGGLYGTPIECLPADLASESGRASVEQRLRADGTEGSAPIDVLVNNAGMGLGGAFARQDPAEIDRLLDLNVRTLVRLTRAVLPVQTARRKNGEQGGVLGVLNVSSLAGILPVPGSAVYGASKAFVTSFSESLATETVPKGVHVTAALPGYVRTEMTRGLQESGMPEPMWVAKETVVDESLRAFAAGRSRVVPGNFYRGADGLLHLAPKGLLSRAVAAFHPRSR